MMTDLHWLSAAELAAAYRNGDTSPVEVVEALLKRIEALDPQLHAFVAIDPETVRAEARTAEAEMRAGNWRGPLHGVPVGFKDNIDVAGMRTACGSKILLDNIAKADAEAVAALRRAGAIILGKLTTFEFAVAGPSDTAFPMAANPWHLDYNTGGSSSGSGVSLAAGLLPLAVGTDTGGSVRNPAAINGIVGMKPTYGLISPRGSFQLAYSLDTIGPMARRVSDVAQMLNAMAVPQRLPASAGGVARFDAELDAGLKGLRVGFVRHYHETEAPVHPEVIDSLRQAVDVLAANGASVRDVIMPRVHEFSQPQHVIMTSEGFAVHTPWMRTRPGDYTSETRRRLLTGAFFSSVQYVQAQRQRAEVTARVTELMQDVDILVVANTAEPTGPVKRSWTREEDQNSWASRLDQQFRAPFSMTRQPALSIMVGLSKNGMPLSMQLVGRHGEDATVLRAAAAYERATEWYKLRPPGIPA